MPVHIMISITLRKKKSKISSYLARSLIDLQLSSHVRRSTLNITQETVSLDLRYLLLTLAQFGRPLFGCISEIARPTSMQQALKRSTWLKISVIFLLFRYTEQGAVRGSPKFFIIEMYGAGA